MLTYDDIEIGDKIQPQNGKDSNIYEVIGKCSKWGSLRQPIIMLDYSDQTWLFSIDDLNDWKSKVVEKGKGKINQCVCDIKLLAYAGCKCGFLKSGNV